MALLIVYLTLKLICLASAGSRFVFSSLTSASLFLQPTPDIGILRCMISLHISHSATTETPTAIDTFLNLRMKKYDVMSFRKCCKPLLRWYSFLEYIWNKPNNNFMY